MIVYGFTKPLDGSEFQNFIQDLTVFNLQKTTGECWGNSTILIRLLPFTIELGIDAWH